MSEDMGTFRIDLELENPLRAGDRPVLERAIGLVFVHVGGTDASDDVVFGEPGDLTLLGARSLEGLNLRVDPVAKHPRPSLGADLSLRWG